MKYFCVLICLVVVSFGEDVEKEKEDEFVMDIPNGESHLSQLPRIYGQCCFDHVQSISTRLNIGIFLMEQYIVLFTVTLLGRYN